MALDRDVRRVMIIGQPGSGKSTLASDLGNLLDLPVFYIDKIHWQSGWVERAGDEKDQLCSEVHSRERWIFEGGRSSTWRERLDRADVLIWLDFPLSVRSWRIIIRTIRYYGDSRPDLPAGCPERFSIEFIRFIWRTRRVGRARMANFFDASPVGKDKYHLCNKAEVELFKAAMTE